MESNNLTAEIIAMSPPKANDFCNTLASARRHGLKGAWSGSAYCSHPCGVIRGGMIFTNDWTTYDSCSVRVMLDPSSAFKPWSTDSLWQGGNPHPQPENGGTLTVYSCGRWVEEDGPWRSKILATLGELKAEIAAAEEIANKKLADERAASIAAHQSVIAKARAAMGAA